MKRLFVLHVIGGGDTGGAMSHLLPLLSALGRAGCDVHLLALGEGGLVGEAEARGLSVAVLPMAGAWDPSILRPLRRVLAGGAARLALAGADAPAGGPPDEVADPADSAAPWEAGASGGAAAIGRWDVVHTHGMRANLPVRLALRGFRHRPCLITTVHSDLKLDYASPLLAGFYRGLDRATLPFVDSVICVSDSLKVLLVERGYPTAKLVTVRSGLEALPDAAAGARPAGAALRRPAVGTAARLVPVKDLDLLLEVAAVLRRTCPEVEVVVVGDGPERARLEARAFDMGLGGVVRFTGRLPDVGPVLAGLDVYLVTSKFEGGVSMAVLEAMAAGIPVVTTAAGGVAEAVEDGITGYVVTRDQERGALAAALAERAAALLNDPELRYRLGTAGALRVREEFSVERTAAATIRIYERCLAARGDLN